MQLYVSTSLQHILLYADFCCNIKISIVTKKVDCTLKVYRRELIIVMTSQGFNFV